MGVPLRTEVWAQISDSRHAVLSVPESWILPLPRGRSRMHSSATRATAVDGVALYFGIPSMNSVSARFTSSGLSSITQWPAPLMETVRTSGNCLWNESGLSTSVAAIARRGPV